MTQPFKAQGAFTALVTPFTDSGDFDSHGFARLLEFQLAEGIDGLVPCGTTGESPTLTWEEHGAAVALAVKAAKGRVTVIAGTGSNNTTEAIDGTRDAWSRGADAALLVDCYYNGPSSLELRTEYYEKVLSAVPEIRLVPYVIPGRTGCQLSSVDLAMLHQEHPDRVPAVKSATGDFDVMRADRDLAGDTLAILSGDDEITLQMMRDEKIRAAGVISVMSNLAPKAVREMCAAQASGDSARAESLAASLKPLFGLVGCCVPGSRRLPDGRQVEVTERFRNPAAVKTMMAGLGMIGARFRAPLGKMTLPAVLACREGLKTVHQESPQVLAPIEAAFGVKIQSRLEDDSAWSELARA